MAPLYVYQNSNQQYLDVKSPEILQDTLFLPTRLWVLEFENIGGEEYLVSKSISAPLGALIIQQKIDEIPKEEEVKEIARNLKNQRITQFEDKALQLEDKLPNTMKRAVTLAKGKGASNSLNVLPLEEEGYVLNKEEFQGALYLRHNMPIKGLPSRCPCQQPFNPIHAMNCKKGGFIHMRHNDLRDLEARLLSEVCKDVRCNQATASVLTGEALSLSTAISEDSGCLDIKARGFYQPAQTAFFDARVTNLNAKSQNNLTTEEF